MKKSFHKVLFVFLFTIFAFRVFANGNASEKEESLRIKLDITSQAGWGGSRGGNFSNFSYDEKTKVASFVLSWNWQGITKQVELPPGRYILRAVVKTNSFAAKLYMDEIPVQLANVFNMPIGVSNEFREIVLPFYVDGKEKKKYYAGIARVYLDPSKHEAVVQVKEMEIIRLGDTALPDNWASKISTSIVHGLDTLKNISRPDRPGKVIFNDAFVGTELWLMTQGGEVNMSYAGSQDFSNEGKYFFAGKRSPGDIIRTDGTYRYRSPRSGMWANRIPWLFPWEEKRLSSEGDPSGWICTSRNNASLSFLNLETGKTYTINLPVKPGWRLIQTPSEDGGRGPRLKYITREILVWQSEDRKQLGISDMEGNNFRSFRVKSISKNPEKDVVYPAGEKNMEAYAMNSVWGKSGMNWSNAVDKDGTRYFLFEINRNSYLSDENPYQVWALPLSLNDNRGLLRAVVNPVVKQIPWTGERPPWKGDSWWNLAGGLPRSGDNTPLLLEDGTLVHMNALGMHSDLFNTVSVNNPYNGEVRFIGNYPGLDHVSWPHEFRRDSGFAYIWAKVVPTVPFIMADLEHDTLWTVAAMNYYDVDERAKVAASFARAGAPGSGRVQAKLIWSHANPSPDYTKAGYASSMLTVGRPEYQIGDAYIAVTRYPQPPVNLRIIEDGLAWEKPRYHAEIKGYNLYRSKESGRGYVKANSELIKGESVRAPSDGRGFYVMTSVEHSGLESRMFSNEVQAGTDSRYRLFYEAEEGKINKPMVPFFEPKAASNAYGVAVTDPALLYKERLEKGLKGSVALKIEVPSSGSARLMGRVRGMSRLECESYTTGWPEEGQAGKGSFSVKVDGKPAGRIPVSGYGWKWVSVDTGSMPLRAGMHEVILETSDAGIAVDNIMVTNDMGFTPAGKSNAPAVLAGTLSGLKAEIVVVQGDELKTGGYSVKPPYVKLSWNELKASQGVRYYNVYRSETPKFETSPATLVGSTTEPEFVDCVLEAGKTYYYRVVALDNWDNRSTGSPALAVNIK